MKKKIILFILLLCVSFFNIDNCYADLTESQADEVASFAEQMILKANTEHKDADGLPLIAYSQEGRNDGMAGKLTYFRKDYNGVNSIYKSKWAFDCASFASYVYHHTLGISAYINSFRPYTVNYFVTNANSNSDFKNVFVGIKVSDIDFSKLKKGDLIVFVGEHIMIYIGDGKIAHLSSSAIKEKTSLGAEIVDLKWRYHYKTANIIRIADGRIGEDVVPNVTIKWPDTGKEEYLGTRDDLPIIDYQIESQAVKEYKLPITFSDDKGLVAYSISTNSNSFNWISLNKQVKFVIEYELTSNEKYYISAIDTKNQITTKVLDASFVDNTKPFINNISYKFNDDKTFDITIDATDDNELLYSLDGKTYSESNSFNNIKPNTYSLHVKDKAGNITLKFIDLSDSALNMANILYDKKMTNQINLKITFNSNTTVSYYNITEEFAIPNEWKKVESYTLNYKINKNGVYYLWTKNKENVFIYYEIEINQIDNIPPVISDITASKKENNLFELIIESYDNGCGIDGYSLDGKKFQEENQFNNVGMGVYNISVKDKCNNVVNKQYKLYIAEKESSDITLVILIILLTLLLGIIFIFRRKIINFVFGLFQSLNQR